MSASDYASLYEAQFIPEPAKPTDVHQHMIDAMAYAGITITANGGLFYDGMHKPDPNIPIPRAPKPEAILDAWAKGPTPRKKPGLWPYQQQQIPKTLSYEEQKKAFQLQQQLIDKYYAPPSPPVIPKDLISDPSIPITGKHADLVIMDDVHYTTTAHKSQGTDWSEVEKKFADLMGDVPFTEQGEPGYLYAPVSENPCGEVILTNPEPMPYPTGFKWYGTVTGRMTSDPVNEASVSDFEL